jgi:uncharacterized protein YbaA (DUF1428 family)
MIHYIGGFVISLPKNKIDDYRRIAQKAGEVWRDHGPWNIGNASARTSASKVRCRSRV